MEISRHSRVSMCEGKQSVLCPSENVQYLCEFREMRAILSHTLDTGDPGSHSSQAPSQVFSLENQAGGAGLGPHPWHLMPAWPGEAFS